jgi:hypothetical protein
MLGSPPPSPAKASILRSLVSDEVALLRREIAPLL